MQQISGILIIEILGRPAEYIKESLTNLVEKLGKEEKVELVSKKIAEPKSVENNIFSCFAEIELKADFVTFLSVVFRYMPSHIEIIEPEKMDFKNSDLNLVVNEIVRRLHQYDEIAKAVLIERDILKRQLMEIQAGKKGKTIKKKKAKKKAARKKTEKKKAKKK